jgi:acetyl esterase/lipase
VNRKTQIIYGLSILAFFMGTAVILPTIGSTLPAIPQMTMTEFPWIPIIACVVMFFVAYRQQPRLWTPMVLTVIGLFFAIQPILQTFSQVERLDSAMRLGLGENYEEEIPAGVRMSPTRFSVFDALGARNFGSGATITSNVEFFSTPQRNLLLDVYEPQVEPAVGDTYPAVIVIHGGSWDSTWLDKSVVFDVHDRYLASLGYVVFDIQYRLSQEAIWPAQLQDILCAVAWARTVGAEQYRVDPNNIALLGRSAGAQLALVAAYRGNDPTVDMAACGMEGVDTSVSAVVSYYAPTDLRMWYSPAGDFIPRFLGGIPSEVPQTYADASPTTWVRDGLPATLLVMGYMDNYVVPYQSEYLANLLQATDSTVVVLRLSWSRHGFDFLVGSLGAQMTEYDVDRFLAWSFYHDE